MGEQYIHINEQWYQPMQFNNNNNNVNYPFFLIVQRIMSFIWIILFKFVVTNIYISYSVLREHKSFD